MANEALCAEGGLAVRRVREDDLDELFALLSDPAVMRYLEPPYDRERAADLLRTAGLSQPPLLYAAEEDGKFLGYVIFHRYGFAFCMVVILNVVTINQFRFRTVH